METTIAGTKVDTTNIKSVLRAWNGEDVACWRGKVTITFDDGAVVAANVMGYGDVELEDIAGEDEHACEAVEVYRDVYETELTKYLGRA